MEKFTTFDKSFWITISIFLCVICAILFLPYFLFIKNWFWFVSPSSAQIGETIGGILGPFIAIMAAVLTFIAFWVQFKFNKQQWHSIQIDRLENRVFELLNLHKQNVQELSLRSVYANNNSIFSGRNIFPHLFDELSRTYKHVIRFFSDLPADLQINNATNHVAYLIFFIGVGEENEKYLLNRLSLYSDHSLALKLINYFRVLQNDDYFTYYPGNPDNTFPDIEYRHFNGYQSSLGHYYRHLFQTVKYIDAYPDQVLPATEKYNYIKTIRAQLSNHEQLLLYYNAISKFGAPWLVKNEAGNYLDSYLIKYKMIKNIPLPLADFGIKPEELFKKEIELLSKKKPPEKLFELHEIINHP